MDRGAWQVTVHGVTESQTGLSDYYYCYPIPITRWPCVIFLDFPGGSDGKKSACNSGDLGSIPGLGISLGKKKWQPTPVFLPGEFHGQRSLAGESPWVYKEPDTNE